MTCLFDSGEPGTSRMAMALSSWVRVVQAVIRCKWWLLRRCGTRNRQRFKEIKHTVGQAKHKS